MVLLFAMSPLARGARTPIRKEFQNESLEASYVIGDDGANECPRGFSKLTEAECRDASGELGMPYQGSGARDDRPGGCWAGSSGNANFNSRAGRGSSGRSPVCGSSSPASYFLGNDGSNSCPSGSSKVTAASQCEIAADALGLPYQGSSARDDRPGGCWAGGSGNANFNPNGGRGTSGRNPICSGSQGPSPNPSPVPSPVPSPSGVSTLDVRVIVLLDENGNRDSSRPWYDSSAGTMPLRSNGNVSNPGGSLATDLTEADIREIFQAVNEVYSDTGIRWNVVGPFFTKPTVPCGSTDLVCGRHKCRSSGYFTKYWGTINKQISKNGREERATNMFSNLPRELFHAGAYHMVYQKYMGWSSQGVVFGTSGSRELRGSGQGHVSVATCGQWANKFSSRPEKRPNYARCGASANCGVGMHYTTAHELGHLLGLGHTDRPSIMTGGGRTASDSRFSRDHIRTIQRNKGTPVLINSQASSLSGSPNGGSRWRRNEECR